LGEEGDGIPGMFMLFNHFVNEAIEAAFLLVMCRR